MNRAALLLLAVLPLSGCVHAAAATPEPWQHAIREPDRKRLAGLWAAWTRALSEADKAGHGSDIGRLGDAIVPDAAKTAALPSTGTYRCRVIKLGQHEAAGAKAPVDASAKAMAMQDFAPCTITAQGDHLHFDLVGPAQRLAGTLYPDGDRQVFLGTMALSGESGVMPYGADPDRDQVGVLRPLGANHWRLELPWPKWQSNLDIIEIVPG
jgi:hypothetical protein